MRDLPALDGGVRELDCRGLCAVPGLVDCHTHAAFGGDRVDEFSLRAGGASYEELHAAGGGILSTVRATRAAGEARPARRGRAAPLVDAPRGHDDLRGEVRLRARPRDRAGLAPRDPGGGRYPDLARRPRGAAGVRRRRRLPRLRARGGAARSGRARGGGGRLPRARRIRRGAGAAVPRGVRRRRPRAAAPRRPVHGVRCDPARGRARAPARSTISRRRATTGSGRSPSSDVVGVLLPASALFLDRPMPPARALVDAGAAVALATDFNPGSAFCESLPLVCSLAATQLHLSPAEALAACTVNAAHVLGRADRIGRLAPGYRADVTLLDAPGLALPRLPPRRPRRRQGGRRGRATLAVHADQEAAAPGAEGAPARVRDRLGRRGGERARGAARGGRPPRPRSANGAKPKPQPKAGQQRGGRAGPRSPAAVVAARREARRCSSAW